MTTIGDANQRVGNDERQAAVDALNQHWQSGRLDPAEHERRTTAAYAAVTRGDLDALFSDLPDGAPAESPAPVAATSAPPAQPPAQAEAEQTSGGSSLFPAGSSVGRNRHLVMSLTPFIALLLFFVTHWWVWFLLIPAVGIVLYAGDDDSRRADRRRR